MKRVNLICVLGVTVTLLLVVAGLVRAENWDLSGTNIYNTNSGRVGIGTSNPQAKLQIVGGGGKSIDFLVNGRMKSNSNDGGLWVSSDRFVGGFDVDKIGFWNNGLWRFVVQNNGIPVLLIRTIGLGTVPRRN